ncbi:hypothetical protein ACFE04_020928 [Oxalis oulophora]
MKVTGHGFGHATHVVEVVRNLILASHDVHVVTVAPDFVFTSQFQSPHLFIRKVLLDCGAVQVDALTVDRLASLDKYSETAVVPRKSILKTQVEWLNSIKADLVVYDVVSVACRSSANAGIRYVCVCGISETQEVPPNFIKLPKDAYTPDLIAASDCMLGQCTLCIVYYSVDKPYLKRAITLKPCYEVGNNGGELLRANFRIPHRIVWGNLHFHIVDLVVWSCSFSSDYLERTVGEQDALVESKKGLKTNDDQNNHKSDRSYRKRDVDEDIKIIDSEKDGSGKDREVGEQDALVESKKGLKTNDDQNNHKSDRSYRKRDVDEDIKIIDSEKDGSGKDREGNRGRDRDMDGERSTRDNLKLSIPGRTCDTLRFKDNKEMGEAEVDPERDQRTIFSYQMPLMATERHVYEFFSKASKADNVFALYSVGGASKNSRTCVCAADGLPKVATDRPNSTCFSACKCTTGSSMKGRR